jgi:NAD(P)-dependent dehydrogenase (short-subunit alcohol dehydrogenase family)
VDSVLANNAGILDFRPFLMSSMDGFWRVVEVNFKGVSRGPFPSAYYTIRFSLTIMVLIRLTAILAKQPLQMIHAVLPRMRAQGGGCIINIASRSGTVDVPMALGYNTSKAALIRATHTLQKEMEVDGLDPAIHLYALHPGGVLTGTFTCPT